MKHIVLTALISLLPLSAATLTLEDCYKQALKNNLSLKSGEIQKSLAENNRKGALYDFYDLTGSYNGDYTYGKDYPDNDPESPLAPNKSRSSSLLTNKAGISLNANLSLGLIDNYKMKKLAESSTSLTADKARLNLLQSVTAAFYGLASSKDELEMKKEQIELSRLQYEQEKLKLQLGNSTRSELFAAEVEYSADSLAIFTSETNVKKSKQELLSIINSKESYDTFDISVEQSGLDSYEPVGSSVESLIIEALNSRADYQAEKNSLQMAQIQLDMAEHKYLPLAYASAGTDYSHIKNMDSEALTRNFGYQLSLGLKWNVSLLSDCNSVENSKLLLEKSSLELENSADQIASEVKTAYLNIKMQEQQLLQSRKHLELTKQNLELAEEMYRLGKKSLIEMVSAKNNYITAKKNSISARYDYKIAYSKLMNAIGK